MNLKSWSYYIQLRAYDESGNIKEDSALYIVGLPIIDDVMKAVEMECYAQNYIPQEFAIAYGKAYAIGTDMDDIKNLSNYKLNAYDKETDLYIFNENVNFHEGLEQVFRILLEQSFKDFELIKVEPVIDVSIPPTETLREVFDKVMVDYLK
ncbi:MAG: hypothetical protein ACP5UF_06045 [Hydrogenobaculum sp.]